MSHDTVFEPSPFEGVQLVSRDTSQIAVFGPIDGTGVLHAERPVGTLDTNDQAQVLHMQSLHKTTTGRFVLGNAASVVVLAPQF
jgi:hypothetical protein